MWESVKNIADMVLSCILFLIAGSILSIPVNHGGVRISKGYGRTFIADLALMGFSALLGLLVPVNIYGLLPVGIAVLAAGFPLPAYIPMVVSNTLFNMLVPYTDPMFIWKTGMNRIILAFIAGILAGLLVKKVRKNDISLLRVNIGPYVNEDGLFHLRTILKLIHQNISMAGGILLIGGLLNELFNGYLVWWILKFIFNNPGTSFLPAYFARLDVMNPFFLLSMNIMYMLMNLLVISGLFVVFKLKGVLLYILYYGAWAGLLGLSVLM